MKLNKITIRRLPGIYSSFCLDKLSEGINVIFGPNGSGKSSICRLIKTSLWKRNANNIEETDASIVWQKGDSSITTEIFNTVKWQENSSDILQNIPEEIVSNCFNISLTEILDSKTVPESGIARNIYIEMTGGCDFDLIKNEFKIRKKALEKEYSQYETLLKEKKELEFTDNKLGEQEDSIGRLKKELAESKQAINRLEEFAKLENYLANNELIHELTVQIDSFPDNIRYITTDTLSNYRELDNNISEHQQAIEKINSKLQNLNNEMQKITSCGALPEQSRINEAQQIILKLNPISQQIENADIACSSFEAKLESIAGELKIYNIDLKEKLFFIPKNIQNFLTCLQKIWNLKRGIGLLELKIENIEKEINLLSLRSLENLKNKHLLASKINDRLELPDKQFEKKQLYKLFSFLAVFGIIFTAASYALLHFQHHHELSSVYAFLHHEFLPEISFLPFIGIGIFISSIITVIAGILTGNHLRKQLETEYKKLSGFSKWNREQALELLKSLTLEITEIEADKNKLENLKYFKDNLIYELNAKQNEIEKIINNLKQTELFQKITLDIENLETSNLLQIISQYRFEYFNYLEAKEKLTKINTKYTTLKNEVVELLNVKSDEPLSLEKLTVIFNSLKDKIYKINTLNKDLENEQALLKSNQKQHKQLFDKREQIIQKLKIKNITEVEFELQQLNSLLPKYEKLVNERTKLNIVNQNLKDIENIVKKYNKEDIPELKTALQAKADKHDNLIKEIQKIEMAVELAGRDKKITECGEKISIAKYNLDNEADKNINKLVSEFLVEKIEKQYELNNQPEIMDNAVRTFSRFTGNKYALKITKKNNEPVFYVQNNNNKKYFSLHELSDGTRVQLFLAVRLAFIKSIERNKEKLPLFFDETLANSDISRFEEIAKTFFYIAKEEKRQIFYLTSDINDVAKFEKFSVKSSGLPIKYIDLENIKNDNHDDKKISYQDIKTNIVCKPEKLTAEEYAAKLKLPVFNPYSNINGCHLFYIMRNDLDTLYSMLSNLSIETIGEFNQLFRLNPELCKNVLSEEKLGLIRLRITILKEYQKYWMIGRPGPITDLSFLNRFNLSQKYLEAIRDLLKENSASEFIEILNSKKEIRLKRFQNSKKQEIIEFLYNNNFLSNEKTMENYKIKSNIYENLENSEFINNYAAKKILEEINKNSLLFQCKNEPKQY